MKRFLHYLSEQASVTFRLISAKEAADLLSKYHYLGRMPRATRVVAAAYRTDGDNPDQPIAAVFFGMPAARWKEPVLELTRLVRAPNAPVENTRLMAFAANAIKQNKNLPQLLISYADPAAGHHGGVYQAASWNYAGVRKSDVDGAFIDGTFYHRRTLGHQHGTSSMKALQRMYPEKTIVPRRMPGKHLYWRAIDNRAEQQAKRLGLEKIKPYPTSDKVTESVSVVLNDDLRKWFGSGKEGGVGGGGWDRYNTKGERIGKCGGAEDRGSAGEGKPKCLSKEKAAQLRAQGGQQAIANAVRRKKSDDPTTNRPGTGNTPRMVSNRIGEATLIEKNVPTNPDLWSRAKSEAKKRFDVYPSAYANGWAAKWYKERGGKWKTKS